MLLTPIGGGGNYLKLDGSSAMAGDINVANYSLDSVGQINFEGNLSAIAANNSTLLLTAQNRTYDFSPTALTLNNGNLVVGSGVIYFADGTHFNTASISSLAEYQGGINIDHGISAGSFSSDYDIYVGGSLNLSTYNSEINFNSGGSISDNGSGGIATANNTLDDGNGNMTFANHLYGGNGQSQYFDSYLNFHFGDTNGNQWSINDDNNSGAVLFSVNSSVYSNPNSVHTLNNTLDDGSGYMTITGNLFLDNNNQLNYSYDRSISVPNTNTNINFGQNGNLTLSDGGGGFINIDILNGNGITTTSGTVLDDGGGGMSSAHNTLDDGYGNLFTYGGIGIGSAFGSGGLNGHAFNVNGLSQVTTYYNTLDDGSGNMVIAGGLSWNSGQIKTLNSSTDSNGISINAGSTGAQVACIQYNDSSGNGKIQLGWINNSGYNIWSISDAVSQQLFSINRSTYAATFLGSVTASSFSGSGASLTSLNGSNIASGTVPNARTTGVSTNTASTLVLRDSSGNFAANVITGNFANTVVTKSAAYTILTTDSVIFATNAGSTYSLTLPTAVGVSGREYTIKKTDNNTNQITIATTSSQTIDGSTTYALSAYNKYVTVISDGANWKVIGNN